MNYNLPSYARSIPWRELGLLDLRSIRWQERNQRFDGSAGLGEMGRAHRRHNRYGYGGQGVEIGKTLGRSIHDGIGGGLASGDSLGTEGTKFFFMGKRCFPKSKRKWILRWALRRIDAKMLPRWGRPRVSCFTLPRN